MKCPKCNTEILSENINIQANIARCLNCNNIFKVSETLFNNDPTFDMNIAPNGAWIVRDFNQLTLGATTRSSFAFFLVPFMLVWSGGSLTGIYGSQIISGNFSLFKSLFGLPFLIGSVIFGAITLMAIWGKVEIVLDNQQGEIFTGIGTVGIRKKFRWSEVSTIAEDKASIRYPESKGRQILIEGRRRIVFGSGLNTDRIYYLLKSLQKVQTQVAKGGKL